VKNQEAATRATFTSILFHCEMTHSQHFT